MDLKMLLSGIDLDNISDQLKEILEMVKTENASVKLNSQEDHIYILLDIKPNDIIAYRITTGVIKLEDKNYIEIIRTLGKWNLGDLKNLIGEGAIPIENTLKRLMPIINGFNSLIKLFPNEKRVSIQLDITNDDIIAYQIVLAIYTTKVNEFQTDEKNVLVVNRILGKYNLNEYLKTV